MSHPIGSREVSLRFTRTQWGVLAAQQIKPQAGVLAAARGISCVEVDLDVLRGAREPELTLFV